MLFQPVVQIDGKFTGDVAAAAAAFDIVKRSLAEQSDTCSRFQREGILFVFQKHHTFTGSPAGQLQMFFSCSNLFFPFIKR